MPICQFARAKRSKLFRDVTSFGYCAAKKATYKRFHGHVIIDFHGTITGLIFPAADVDERIAVLDMIDDMQGLLIGDKGYMSQGLHAYLKEHLRIDLQTPLRANMHDDRNPDYVRRLMGTWRLVATVIGQLSERFHIEKVRARDLWHLTSRIARKVLAHTVGVFLNRQLGKSPWQFEGLITA